MKHQITKYQRSSDERYDFSLLIPTWNNLPFIQNCLQSIEKNSTQKIQIIVIVNEGIDGTYAWFTEQNKYDFIYSKENIGICYAVNICRSLILSDYIVYANDDMYFCRIGIKFYMKKFKKQNIIILCFLLPWSNRKIPEIPASPWGIMVKRWMIFRNKNFCLNIKTY